MSDFDEVEDELKALSNTFRQSLGSVIQFYLQNSKDNNISVKNIFTKNNNELCEKLDELCLDNKWVNYDSGQMLSAKSFAVRNKDNLDILVQAMANLDSEEVKHKVENVFSYLEDKYNVGIFIPPNGKKEFALLTFHPFLKVLDSVSGMPAIETFNSSLSTVAKHYYENGCISNVSGPAVISYFADGKENTEYWIGGNKVSFEAYGSYVKNISSIFSSLSENVESLSKDKRYELENTPIQGLPL